MTAIHQLEFQALEWVRSTFHHEILDMVMPKVSFLGDAGWIWILLVLILMLIKPARRMGLAAALALVFSLIVTNIILKPLVARVRPFEIDTAIQLLVSAPKDYSFPSGHTTASFAAATAIYRNHKRIGLAALLLAALIAFSRLYLQVHFVTDILAGAVIGYCLGGVADTLVDGLRSRYKAKRRKRRRREA